MKLKQFILYIFRWQFSTPILYLCMLLPPLDNLLKTIIANLIGACIFFWVDNLIFKNKSEKSDADER